MAFDFGEKMIINDLAFLLFLNSTLYLGIFSRTDTSVTSYSPAFKWNGRNVFSNGLKRQSFAWASMDRFVLPAVFPAII
jgi:hypothetical protein